MTRVERLVGAEEPRPRLPDALPDAGRLECRDPRHDLRAGRWLPALPDRRGPRRPRADEPDTSGHGPDRQRPRGDRRRRVPVDIGSTGCAACSTGTSTTRPTGRPSMSADLHPSPWRHPILHLADRAVARLKPGARRAGWWEARLWLSVSPLAFAGLRLAGRRRVVRLGRFGTLVNDPILGRRILTDPERFRTVGPGHARGADGRRDRARRAAQHGWAVARAAAAIARAVVLAGRVRAARGGHRRRADRGCGAAAARGGIGRPGSSRAGGHRADDVRAAGRAPAGRRR